MYLSILRIDSLEIRGLLETYIQSVDYSKLSKKRPALESRRSAALAIARDLLVQNHLLSCKDALLTEIKHHPSGEPFLKFPVNLGQKPLHISISHSGSWIACLISPAEIPACIDLEDLTIKRDYSGIAEHYFSDDEKAFVKVAGALGFYKIWTAKEAIAKLRGKGLSEALGTNLDSRLLNIDESVFNGSDFKLFQESRDGYFYTIASTERTF